MDSRIRMAADGRAADSMARLDDPEPLLVQRNVGRGLVLMLGKVRGKRTGRICRCGRSSSRLSRSLRSIWPTSSKLVPT